MHRISSRRGVLHAAPLLISLSIIVGCGQDTPTLPTNVGTTAELRLPESDPPVLTKAVADRIRLGMSQEGVISFLRDAARDTPSARSSVEAMSTQSKLNNIRYDLTLTQGPRKLVLAFKADALVDKKQVGFE
jgi:hypothetical protein